MPTLPFAFLGAVVKAMLGTALLLAGAAPPTQTAAPDKPSCAQPPEAGTWRAESADARVERVEIRATCAGTSGEERRKPSFIPQPDWYIAVVARCGTARCDWGVQPALQTRSASIYAVFRDAVASRVVYAQLTDTQPQQLQLRIYVDFADPLLLDRVDEHRMVRAEPATLRQLTD